MFWIQNWLIMIQMGLIRARAQLYAPFPASTSLRNVSSMSMQVKFRPAVRVGGQWNPGSG